MNYTTAIFLISDDVRAVSCTYEAHETAPKTLFKTLNPDIKVDDFVVVPTNTRHEMTVVKVVDTDIDLDVETEDEIKWIVGVVDRADFEEIERQEQTALDKIRSAQKAKKRRELAEALLADVNEDDLKALPIYSKHTAQAEDA